MIRSRIACLLLPCLFGLSPMAATAQDAGDPLPKGALLRFGTNRWRAGVPYSSALGFDGKRLFIGGAGAIRVLDMETGLPAPTFKAEIHARRLVVAPDGKTLAAACYPGVVFLDIDSGKELRSFKAGDVAVIAFSPDGKKLITGGDDHDCSVRVIDLASGKEELRLLEHQNRVSFAACGSDNKTLISASHRRVHIADMSTGEDLRKFHDERAFDTEVAISPDARTLAIADARYERKQKRLLYTIRLVDAATGNQRFILEKGPERITSILFAPDGKSFVAWGDKDCQVHDAAAGELKRRMAEGHGRYVASDGSHFSPDGRRLILAGTTIRVWDFETGKELHPPEGSLSGADSLAFSPDGATLATSGFADNEVIQLWDGATGRLKGSLKGHADYIRGVRFAADGRLVSGGGDGKLKVWDVVQVKETFEFQLYDPKAGEKRLQVRSFGVSRDGRTLAATAVGFEEIKDKTQLFAWNLMDGKILTRRELAGFNFRANVLSADCKTILQFVGVHLVLKDMRDGKTILKLAPAPQPTAEGVTNNNCLDHPFHFSPDGRLLAAAGSRQRSQGNGFRHDNLAIVIFDLAGGQELHRITMEHDVSLFVFSPDGKRLAGLDGSVVRIWDALTGKRLWESPPFEFRVQAIEFSPDGARLATSLENATIILWNAAAANAGKDRP